MINVVLLEPEIPQNTGNIARTCACTGSHLHLIKPLGFDISEKSIKRAGLDYWDKLKLSVYDNLSDFFALNNLYKNKTTPCPSACNNLNSLTLNQADIQVSSAEKTSLSDSAEKTNKFFCCSTKAKKRYSDVDYPDGCFLLFGKESKGLPENLIFDNYDNAIRIPMGKDIRSLNLSNSVAIILYEALKQHNFYQLT